MTDRSQSIVSGCPHCPLGPHGLEATLDCDCSHGHDWIVVSPTIVGGHVIRSMVSREQKAPVEWSAVSVLVALPEVPESSCRTHWQLTVGHTHIYMSIMMLNVLGEPVANRGDH